MDDTEDTGSAVAEYMRGGAGGVAPTLAQKTQASVGIAIADKPDYEAELKRAASITGVPLDSARADPDSVKNQASLSGFNFDGMAARFPATANYLSNVDNARIAHDDVDNMSYMEKLTTSFKRGLKGTMRGMDSEAVVESAKILNIVDRIQRGELDPSDYAGMSSDAEAGPYASMFAGASGRPEAIERTRQSAEDRLAENALEFVTRGVEIQGIPQSPEYKKFQQTQGFKEAGEQLLEHPLDLVSQVTAESVGGILPSLPLIVGSGAAGGIKGIAGATGLTSFGTEYVNSLTGILGDMGIDVTDKNAVQAAVVTPEFRARNRQALVKAGVIGAFDAATAGVAGARLAKGAVGNLAAQTGVQMAGGAGGEAAGSVASGQEVSASAVISEAIGEVPTAVVDVGTHTATEKLKARQEARTRAADTATQNAEVVEEIAKVAEASKLRERDPASFEEFVKEATKDAPVKDLYVDAKTYAEVLQQAGVDPEAISPTAAKELQAQVVAGGDVRIPIEEFAARAVGTGVEKALLEHLKTDPLGMSKKEAETYYQTFAEEQKAEAEKILADKGVDDAFAQSHEKVKAQLTEQLATANRFTPDVNKSYAALMSSFYTTQAARLGITPEEMFAKYPLQVQAENLVGSGVMDQAEGKFRIADLPRDMREELFNEHATNLNPEATERGFYAKSVPQGMIDVEDLKTARIPEEQLADYVKAGADKLPPIVISDGRLIDGQHRILAAKAQGIKQLRYIDVTGLIDTNAGGFVSELPESFKVAKANKLGQDATYGQSQHRPGLQAGEDAGRSVGGTPRVDWARETRLKRKDGRPVLIYRGTTRNLSAADFDAASLGHSTGNPNSGLGVWFTASREDAEGYGPVVEPFHLDLRNPKVYKNSDVPGFDSLEESHAFQQELRDAGHDGIVLDYRGVGGPIQFVAFDANQAIYPDSVKQTLDQSAPSVPQTETAEFKAWFGDSKVVDENGEPLVVYHGTDENFEAFNTQGGHGKTFGTGAFFSSKPSTASTYATPARGGASVAPVYLSLKRPMVVDALGKNWSAVPQDARVELPETEVSDQADEDLLAELEDRASRKVPPKKTEARETNVKDLFPGEWDYDDDTASTDDLARWARKNGYDGLIIHNVSDQGPAGTFASEESKQPGSIYVAFKPEQIKSAVGNDGSFDANDPSILSQGETPRGQISFGNDIKQGATISLLHNADLSTFLHESGHFYLEVLNDLAKRPDAHPEIAADMQVLLDWFGVKDLDTWNKLTLEEKRPYHEQFARGFESYLFEGKAPSVELNSLFAKFRAWMINVYKQLTALNVSLTPEVRGVMDRLVATNADIVEAETTRGFAPLFKDAQAAGMTPDEWLSYQKLGAEATQEAVNSLQSRSIRDMQWLDNAKAGKLKELQKDAAAKRKEMMREVTDEVRKDPIYGAQRFLKYGELNLEGMNKREREIATNAGMTGTKLSLPALKEMYGDGPAAPWRYLPPGRRGMVTAHDGLHPDLVAELFGFSSGDEMVRKILDAEPEKSVIEGMTDQKMLERYGDLSSEQAIEKAANEAIHNDARARFIATELAAVEKAVGSRRTLTKAAKAFAIQIVARQKIRDLKPARYEAAEARAAKTAERGKDLNEKAVAKREQLVNHYAADAAYKASAEIERGARYLKKFDSAATRKSLDGGYVDQIDALLERFDLRNVSNKETAKRASIAEWIKSQEEQGYQPEIPDALLNDVSRKPYREMTVEEFRGLVDAIKNIEHLGRLKKKLLTAIDNRDFDEVKGLVAAAIRDNAKQTLPEERASDRGALVDIKRMFRGFTASVRKFASFARQFDGWKDGGPVWENLVRNMNERGDFESVEREKATIKLHEILDPLLNGGKLGEKRYFKSSNKSFTREERIGMALNMGNEVNRERVMTGEKLDASQLREVLDTLTKEDWDAVQKVWDFIDSYWSQMQAKQKRLTGLTPEKVEASPVVTKHGTYAGGYYPIKYDPYRSERSSADINAEVQRQIERGLYVASQTRRGHLKARTESTGRPLRYDLNVIAEHVDQVIHDLAWHEYLIDANRLLRAGAIEDAVRTHYGVEAYRAMKDTLVDIAVGDVGARGSAFLNHVRYGASIAGLGLNLANSLINTIGITQSISRIGAKWVAKGFGHWLGDAAQLESSAKKIYEMSDFMRLRAKTQMREVNELRNRIDAADSKLKKLHGKLLPVFFYLQTKSQMLVDIPTFWGAYEKAMAEPDMTEARAIDLAEQAVRDAQGSGLTHDLSGIQRNPMLKLFTTFYHFFNTTYNLTVEAAGRTNFRKPKDVAMLAADLALLYTVPALMQTVVNSLLHGEDDPEKIKKRLIADQISYVMAPIPLAREMTSGVQQAFGVGYDYSGPAAIRFFSDFAKLGAQVNQGELDEAFWKSLNNVGGVLFHYPAGQINRTASGVAALADGRTSNPAALVAGPSTKQ